MGRPQPLRPMKLWGLRVWDLLGVKPAGFECVQTVLVLLNSKRPSKCYRLTILDRVSLRQMSRVAKTCGLAPTAMMIPERLLEGGL